jgi:hypothetical protein
MKNFGILIREHGREVKCYPRVPDLPLSAQGNALRDVTSQGGMDSDGLCHNEKLALI